MRFLRFLGVSCALAIIGFAGVSAAVATASVFGHMSSWVVDFAFGWCTLPAIVLAAVAFGLVHLVERVWTRLASSHRLETRPLGQRVLSAVVTRFSTSSATGATTSSSFHTSVSAEPMPPPSLLVLGVLVAVPLAFLNLPGWLAVDQVVRGPVGIVAIFVVPGVVCGLMVGALAQQLRRRRPAPTSA